MVMEEGLMSEDNRWNARNSMPAALFNMLDLDKDGFLSRTDLNRAAEQYGWSWREAPVFSVFDLLSIASPIPRRRFIAYMDRIRNDPLGPYGKVLRHSPHFAGPVPRISGRVAGHEPVDSREPKNAQQKPTPDDPKRAPVAGLLERHAGMDAASRFQSLLQTLETINFATDDAALLIIDPQRSFTEGAWMRSIGDGAETDVAPIRLAFDNCAALLTRHYGRVETMFTRCPFPVRSYGWDHRLAGIMDGDQLYFIKPGNSVLFPPDNGFRQWVSRCMDSGKKTLVMGGCTLSSCVRVSAIETRQAYGHRGLQVVVDLNLSGARTGNYMASPAFDGRSAVASAVRQMLAAGVGVVRQVDWH